MPVTPHVSVGDPVTAGQVSFKGPPHTHINTNTPCAAAQKMSKKYRQENNRSIVKVMKWTNLGDAGNDQLYNANCL